MARAEAAPSRRAPLSSVFARMAPAVGVIGCIAVILGVSRTSVLFTRPLWLDEIHTWLVAGGPSAGQTLRNLAAGADFNPPSLYLVYRVVGQVAGSLSEVPMRLTSAASVAVALVAVYLLLRDECGRVGAASGSLAALSHPTVAAAAFDARFYGPWLAGLALLLVGIKSVVESRERRLQGLALAALSAFVCTVHYFGVVSWFAAVAAGVLIGRRRGVPARRFLPTLIGPLALALCIPLYLRQRAALTLPTWNPPASLVDHGFLLVGTLLPLALLTPLVAWAASAVLKRVRESPPPGEQRIGVGVALLLAQVAVPLVLALFSLLVQPATQPRYWITGAFAVAALAAVATSRSVPALRIVVVAALVATTVTAVRDERETARRFEGRVLEDATYAARAFREQHLLVARRRHTVYPLLRADTRWSTVATLFDDVSTGADSQLVEVDRAIARIHRRLYGSPRMLSGAGLRAESVFYFVEYDSTRVPVAGEFPGHTVERVDRRLFRVRLR